MSTVVGIDLGTTNSLVAYIKNDRPEIIPNQHGKRLTPSVVGIDKSGKLHVGETAKNQLVAAPERTVAEVKRLMGTSQRIRLGDREYTPQEVSGIILRSLKDDAERFLGHTIDEAVVTVPAYFTDAQRQATKDAGELAGFRVERILNEPTAGALSYGLDNLDKEQYVLVYDLGGGTFDVSVLEMFEGVLDVKASAGNNRLGGSDFDRRIIEYLLKQFERDHGLDISLDIKAMARLKQAAEQAKHEISTLETTSILLPFLAVAGGQPLSLECEFSREQFELLVEDLISSTLEPIDQALHDAKLEAHHIHEVVLVGGSSRIPLVRKILTEKFGKAPRANVNPDEAVALGAAVQAGLKSGTLDNEHGIMITDVCPYTLGVEVVGNTGYQKMPGMFSPILNRNTTIPITRSEIYATTVDRQTHVDIKVYQGESRLVKNNNFIDQYTIDGIPPAPSGAEKISVSFTYDVNGILQVKTKILSTGKEAMLTIAKSAQRMSDDERASARKRLDHEWDRPADDKSRPHPKVVDPRPGSGRAAMGGGSDETATATAVSGAQVKALIASAEQRLSTAPMQVQVQIRELVSQLKSAALRGDADVVRRLDQKLTDVLFDLE